MFNKIEEEESNFWISYTDLITGFMIMFIVIAFWLYSQNKEEEAIKGKYEGLVIDFKDKMRDDNIEIDTVSGTVRFVAMNKILFKNDETNLTEDFEGLLSDFVPKYLKAIYEVYEKQETDKVFIKEIRIEGHASSESDSLSSKTEDEKYIYNLALSNGRALQVYKYLLGRRFFESYPTIFHQFITKNTISCGYSYAKPLDKDGKATDKKNEDYDQSRRVEFRIILEYQKDSKTN